MFWTFSLLLLSGDVEPNPGPPRGRPEPKPDKNKIMQDKVETHSTKLEELESLIKSQAEVIESLQAKQVEMAAQVEEKQVEAEKSLQDLKVEFEARQRKDQVQLVEQLQEQKVNLLDQFDNLKTEQSRINEDLRKDLQRIRGKLTGVDDLGTQSEDTSHKLREMESELEEILEKLWELDKSWKNNLVFYGIKSDPGIEEHPSVAESKIREVIALKMQISREIPILRAKRSWNGPDVRGSKPITVYFEKWQDKDEILRKSGKLKGSNIFVGEDFSKRVKDQRAELQKFMRVMRKKNPGAKFLLQFDKLFIDKDIYVFNELTGQVEQMAHSGISGDPNGEAHSISPTRSAHSKRSKSSGRKRLQKSCSTESSLNNMLDNAPVYSPDSPQKSPHKSIRDGANRAKGNGTTPDPIEAEDTADEPPNDISRSESRESEPRDDQVNGNDNGGGSDGGDDLVDYTDSEPYSPSRRINPQIPETIPE